MFTVFDSGTVTLPRLSHDGVLGDKLLPYYETEELMETKDDNIGITPIHYLYLGVVPEITSALLVAGNILVLIFSFCGGCAAIVVCTRSKFARPGTRYFLISLAIADFLLASFSIVSELAQILHKYNSWALGHFMCIISDYMTTFAMLTSGCCIISIAVDRYFAVVRGLKPPFLSAKWSSYLSYIFMILVWVAPMGISVPLLFAYYLFPYWVYEYNPDIDSNISDNVTYHVCIKKEEFAEFDKWYALVTGLLFLALIFTFIFSYVSILVFIKRNFQHRPGDSPNVPPATSGRNNNNVGEPSITSGIGISGNVNPPPQQQQPQNRHRRTVRLIMVLIILFLLCRVPVWVFRVVTTATEVETNSTTNSVFHSLILLSNVKCAINPFLYTIKNDALRSQNHGEAHGANHQSQFCCSCSSQNKSKFQLSCKNVRENCFCWSRGNNVTSYDFTREHGDVNSQRFYTSDKTELPVKSSSLWHSKNEIKTTDSSA